MADSAATLASLRQGLVNSEVTYNNEMQELVALMNRAAEWADLKTNPRVKTHAFTTAKVKACSDRLLAQAEANENDLYKCFEAYLDNSAEFLTYCTQLADMRSSLQAAGSEHPSVGKASFSSVFRLERALLPLYRLQQIQVLLQDIRQVLVDSRRREELLACEQRIQQVTELSTRCTRLLPRVAGCSSIHSLSELFQDAPQPMVRPSKQNLTTKPASSKCYMNIEPSEINHSRTKTNSNPGTMLRVFDKYSSHSGPSVTTVPVTSKQLLGSTEMYSNLNEIVPKTNLPVESKLTTIKNKLRNSTKQENATEIRPMHTSADKPFLVDGKSANVAMKCTKEDSFRTGRSVFYDREHKLNDNSPTSSSKDRSSVRSKNNSIPPVTKDATFQTLLAAKLSVRQLPQSENRSEPENGANDSVQQIERKMKKLERERKSLEEQLAAARNNVSACGDRNEKRDSDYFSNLSNVSSSESINSTDLALGPPTDSAFDKTVENLRDKDSDIRLEERKSLEINGDTSKTTSNEPSKAFQSYEEPLQRGSTLRRGTIERWTNKNTKVRPHSMHSEFYSTKYIRGNVTRSLLRDSIRRAPLYQTYSPKSHDGESLQDFTELTKNSGEHTVYQNVNPSFRTRMVQENIPSEKENNAGSCDTRCSYQKIINGVEITYENINNQNSGSSIINNHKVNGSVRANCDLALGNENVYCKMGSRKGDLIKTEFPKYDLSKYLTNGKRLGDQDNMHGEYVMPGAQNYRISGFGKTFQVINNNLKRDDSSNLYESVHDLFADIKQVKEVDKVNHHLGSDDSANIYESVQDLFAEIHKGEKVETVPYQEQPAKCTMKEAIRWCAIPEVVASRLLDDLDKRARCLQEAKYEIISSKVSYLKSLSILQVVFIQNQNLSDVLPADDWSNLFGHFEPVKRCSEHFLADLLSGWPQDLLLSKMATVVNQYAQSGLQVYVDFCANHVRMNDTLRGIRENRPSVNKILKRLEADEVCENLPLESFLMSPVKRVTRLPLLVSAILHWLELGGEDHVAWTNTFEQLQAMANECNEAVREAEADKEKQSRTDTEAKSNTNSLKKKPQDKKVKKRAFFFTHETKR